MAIKNYKASPRGSQSPTLPNMARPDPDVHLRTNDSFGILSKMVGDVSGFIARETDKQQAHQKNQIAEAERVMANRKMEAERAKREAQREKDLNARREKEQIDFARKAMDQQKQSDSDAESLAYNDWASNVSTQASLDLVDKRQELLESWMETQKANPSDDPVSDYKDYIESETNKVLLNIDRAKNDPTLLDPELQKYVYNANWNETDNEYINKSRQGRRFKLLRGYAVDLSKSMIGDLDKIQELAAIRSHEREVDTVNAITDGLMTEASKAEPTHNIWTNSFDKLNEWGEGRKQVVGLEPSAIVGQTIKSKFIPASIQGLEVSLNKSLADFNLNLRGGKLTGKVGQAHMGHAMRGFMKANFQTWTEFVGRQAKLNEKHASDKNNVLGLAISEKGDPSMENMSANILTHTPIARLKAQQVWAKFVEGNKWRFVFDDAPNSPNNILRYMLQSDPTGDLEKHLLDVFKGNEQGLQLLIDRTDHFDMAKAEIGVSKPVQARREVAQMFMQQIFDAEVLGINESESGNGVDEFNAIAIRSTNPEINTQRRKKLQQWYTDNQMLEKDSDDQPVKWELFLYVRELLTKQYQQEAME